MYSLVSNIRAMNTYFSHDRPNNFRKWKEKKEKKRKLRRSNQLRSLTTGGNKQLPDTPVNNAEAPEIQQKTLHCARLLPQFAAIFREGAILEGTLFRARKKNRRDSKRMEERKGGRNRENNEDKNHI